MIISVVLLAIAVSLLLVAGAWAIDRLLRPVRLPTRFIWAAAMLATVGLVAVGPIRAIGAPSVSAGSAGVAVLQAINISAVDAALTGATAVASRWLSQWGERMLVLTWALSTLLALIYFVGGALRHRRVMSEATIAIVASERVSVSDEFGPAVIGALRSEIVLPRWLLSRSIEEQSLVVAHERSHIAVRDPLLLLAGASTVVLMPWNPIMWWGYSRLRLAMELDCDARVLRAGAPPLAYGELLLDLTAALPPTRLGAPAFAARPSQLEARILAMSTRPFTNRHRGTAIVAAALTGVIVAVVACSADVSNSPGEVIKEPPKIIVTPSGEQTSAAPTVVDLPYFDFQVEKTVQPARGAGVPRYPGTLRSARVGGEVLVQFVVDTLGRVELESYKVIRTSHVLFEQSVREALPAMRYTPAEVGGKKVRQLVQTPFVFQLEK